MSIIPSLSEFHALLIAMAVAAVVVFVALYFISAGYGMMFNKRWGLSLNNRVGWVLMESPVFIAMCAMWWCSPVRFHLAPLIFFLIFQLHYFQRSFVFPFLLRGKNRMPLSIVAMGVTFNLLNAYIQGSWIFYLGSYSDDWLLTPQFIVGVLVFAAGMAINIHSDYIIRHLRKPGDTKHYIPRGGMFNYVSSAHYFGEWLEWVGFAIATWSWAGAIFALWTFANLAPRAHKIHQRYAAEFGSEFTSLHLKRILPGIY